MINAGPKCQVCDRRVKSIEILWLFFVENIILCVLVAIRGLSQTCMALLIYKCWTWALAVNMLIFYTLSWSYFCTTGTAMLEAHVFNLNRGPFQHISTTKWKHYFFYSSFKNYRSIHWSIWIKSTNLVVIQTSKLTNQHSLYGHKSVWLNWI